MTTVKKLCEEMDVDRDEFLKWTHRGAMCAMYPKNMHEQTALDAIDTTVAIVVATIMEACPRDDEPERCAGLSQAIVNRLMNGENVNGLLVSIPRIDGGPRNDTQADPCFILRGGAVTDEQWAENLESETHVALDLGQVYERAKQIAG